ncbi:MAG: RtcB family protein [Planctomycetaceae bacterium]|nr:RtcB family protein [Planctomycetaceae bacterium]
MQRNLIDCFPMLIVVFRGEYHKTIFPDPILNNMTEHKPPLTLQPINAAEAWLHTGKTEPIRVIGTKAIRDTFDETALQQAIHSRLAPGVKQVVLNPDAHAGYGAPIGCVMVSPTHIYPGPVGVDIKCSMSLLQFELDADAVKERRVRRELIHAVCDRTPTGYGRHPRKAGKSRHVDRVLGFKAVTEGASQDVCERLGIPPEWANRCEDAFHRGHNGTISALAERLNHLLGKLMTPGKSFMSSFPEKMEQLGSYGGGNHFGECEIVHVAGNDNARKTAEQFGLRDGNVAFLSHCGSRGFGNLLATGQFQVLQQKFQAWGVPFPANDKQLVYAPLGSPEADDYLDDMALGGNFATVNHLLINTLVYEAFQEVFPGVKADLIYYISHNIARLEPLDGKMVWVHRKGATRAFPANHPSLAGTPFETTGHPILLPGNPRDGSVVMVAEEGAVKSCYSVNHGAGRQMSRMKANRELDQRGINDELDAEDILTNCRNYPKDEAPAAYKDFREVLKSVEGAGLAREVARLKARFVIKDGDTADD